MDCICSLKAGRHFADSLQHTVICEAGALVLWQLQAATARHHPVLVIRLDGMPACLSWLTFSAMIMWCAAAGIPEGKPEDRELAWRRTFDFFKQHLG